MKQCFRCKESKPYSYFHKAHRNNDGYSSYCKLCAKAATMESYWRNPERVRARARNWAKANAAKCRLTNQRWINENREHVRARDRARYQRDKQKILDRQKQYAAKNRDKTNAIKRRWSRLHPECGRANCRARQALKRQAVPVWADFSKIKAFYAKARKLEERTGERYHVDHIVPLKSPLVCGLHCEENLTILKAPENIRKGNRAWPDMP